MSQEMLSTTGNSPNTWLGIVTAMMNLLTANQNVVSNGVNPLGTTMLQIENSAATGYNNYMQGPLETSINNAVTAATNNSNDSFEVQAATAQLSTTNSELNQSNSFWSGLSQAANQTGSDISSTLQLIYTMIQQGILTTLSVVTKGLG